MIVLDAGVKLNVARMAGVAIYPADVKLDRNGSLGKVTIELQPPSAEIVAPEVMKAFNVSTAATELTQNIQLISGFGDTTVAAVSTPTFRWFQEVVPDPAQPSANVTDFFEALGFQPLGLSPLPGPSMYKIMPDVIDLNVFGPSFYGHYSRYTGSIATPPCTQGVKWFILARPVLIPKAVEQTFHAYFPDPLNARPTQALNDRVVRMDSGNVDDSEPFAIRRQKWAWLYGGNYAWYYQDFNDWITNYPDCSGDRQSPININLTAMEERKANLSEPLPEQARLKATYVPKARRMIANNGHSFQVDGEFGNVIMPDGIYEANQFHFHFPSEHAINGRRMAGEMHIVHQRRGSVGANDLLILAIMLDTPEKVNGTVNASQKPKQKHLDFFHNLGFSAIYPVPLPKPQFAQQVFYPVDINTFGDTLNSSFTCYWGSLTTPPCAETVKWMIFNTPVMIPNGIVQRFKVSFPNPMNTRPLQPVNDRLIKENCHTGGYVERAKQEAAVEAAAEAAVQAAMSGASADEIAKAVQGAASKEIVKDVEDAVKGQ
jgi:carbonic anhydrase